LPQVLLPKKEQAKATSLKGNTSDLQKLKATYDDVRIIEVLPKKSKPSNDEYSC